MSWAERRLALRFAPDATLEHAYPGASSLASACIQNWSFLSAAFERLGTSLVREAGIPSVAALATLEVLQAAGQPLSPSVVAERLALTRATVTGILDSLERHGLARRRPSETDGRMRLIEITPEANLRLMRLVPRLRRAEATWLAALNASEQRQLLDLAAALQANLPSD